MLITLILLPRWHRSIFYMYSQTPPPPRFHFIGAHAHSFVGCVCGTNFYLLFYPSSTHVRALSQLLL
jgi:hypothetical protein